MDPGAWKLREWDCASAPQEELDSWLAAYNQALAADLPDDPPWCAAQLRECLTVTMPGERRLTWLAEGGDGQLLGYGRLLMLTGLGVIEVFVVPPARHRGVGRALVAAIAARAVAEGFHSLGVELAGGTAAASFYASLGFSHAYTEIRSILDLNRVAWDQIAELAAGVVPGYRLEYHPYDLPDEMLEAYAEAKQIRRLDPTGELELRPSSYDAQRLRASLRCLRERGLMPYVVVAVYERTQRVAALTEVVLPAQHPSRADQYDTVVVPEHDGYGLARAVKARLLLELHAAHPQLRQVQTWQDLAKVQLQHIDQELGFRTDREWYEYEADARELAATLASGVTARGEPAPPPPVPSS